MANLYTKTGDKGQTSLVGGSRVSKSSLRVECYGTIDEANSMLGLAYAQTDREYIRTTVHRIQGRLFALGAELASDEQGAAGLTGKISEEDVAFLEGVVDKCTETTGKQTHFVIPGVDPARRTMVRATWSAMWWPWRSTSRYARCWPATSTACPTRYTRWPGFKRI